MIGIKYNNLGMILAKLNVPENQVSAQLGTSEYFLEGSFDDANNYVINPGAGNAAVVSRPSFAFTINKTSIQSDGVDVCSIANIPTGTDIFLQGTHTTISDSNLNFTTTEVGDHIMTFTCFPYMPQTITIVGY